MYITNKLQPFCHCVNDGCFGVLPFHLLPFHLLPFRLLPVGLLTVGLLPIGLLLFHMSVETNLVQACSINKVTKSITVHPSLLIWQR